jgi:asparagine synthase (glutamine-hydrolysing)
MKVMLSGMGADEVFAGYPRHLAYRISRVLDRVPAPLLRLAERAAAPAARPGPPGRLRGPRRNLWKYMRGARLAPGDRYLSYASYYAREELTGVLAPELRGVLAGYDPYGAHRAYLDASGTEDELERILYLDAKTFLPCLNLTYTDKMSMAASVEVRVPLLDDDLVDLARRIPSDLKLRGWRRKYVLKRSQERWLPKDVVWRRKAGFGAPVRAWLDGDLAPLVDDLLAPETLRRRGLVDAAAVAAMRSANAAGQADYSLRLYALLTLELWQQTFLDRTWTFEAIARPATVAA